MRRRDNIAVVGLVVAVLSATATAGADATFSGRNGLLSYSVGNGGKEGTLATGAGTIDPRTGATRVTRFCIDTFSAGCTISLGTSFAPGGDALAVQTSMRHPSAGDFGNWLDLVRHDGTSIARVPATPFLGPPAWSPNGSRLLVTRSTGTGTPPDIFMIGIDGRELGRVTTGGGREPDWASNGAIAYVLGKDIYLTRLGETPRRLTYRGGATPSWSPDARRLAFARHGQIWTVRADGRAPRRLTRARSWSPAWSPDGRRIAFLRGGTLYLMRSDGRAQRRVGRSPDRPENGIANIDWQALKPR